MSSWSTRLKGSLLLLFFLAACNLPQNTAPGNLPSSATPNAPLASSVPLTATLPSPPVPTNPPSLTPSPLPSATATLTLTPTITLTPTPSTPMISVSVDTNCRSGPGKAYDRVGALMVGETAEVLARDPSGLFWYIPNPDRAGTSCWVWGQYATIEGETASLPVFTPPPTPTPAQAFAIKNVKLFTGCVGTSFYIQVANTGQTNWQSYRVNVTDLNTSATDVDQANGFAAANVVCGPSLSIDALTPGQDGYIFYYNIGSASHKMRFVVTLYGNDNQQGVHITHTIEYHP